MSLIRYRPRPDDHVVAGGTDHDLKAIDVSVDLGLVRLLEAITVVDRVQILTASTGGARFRVSHFATVEGTGT